VEDASASLVAVLFGAPAVALDAVRVCPAVVAVRANVPAVALDAVPAVDHACPEDANVAVRANVPDAVRANALT